jgi:hypothetical protein
MGQIPQIMNFLEWYQMICISLLVDHHKWHVSGSIQVYQSFPFLWLPHWPGYRVLWLYCEPPIVSHDLHAPVTCDVKSGKWKLFRWKLVRKIIGHKEQDILDFSDPIFILYYAILYTNLHTNFKSIHQCFHSK